MSSTFESIKNGLEEAVAYSQGKPVEVRIIGIAFETGLLQVSNFSSIHLSHHLREEKTGFIVFICVINLSWWLITDPESSPVTGSGAPDEALVQHTTKKAANDRFFC